ncbi:hypothetical protein CL633_02170 [bacterium]|nr:hypothetical protein [bacterium]|tara:strand:+ start:954 stop:2207 length:1254 start_codon:yes stop_codon:yes gene_type:complete
MKIPQKPLDFKTKFLNRTALGDIKKNLFDRDILVITGARQVGKTSIMHLLYRFLIKNKNINLQNILFFDLEDIQALEAIESYSFDEFAKYIMSQGSKNQTKFVFIDEIQYLQSPSSLLKILHDHYPKIKLIVSGSSSLSLKQKFKDTLTGRKQVFVVNPLSFKEYCEFTQTGSKAKRFDDFAVWGGYPEAVLINDPEKRAAKLREIHSSYIKKDIKDLMGIENVSGFNKLVDLLAHQIGNLINIDELANSSGLARDTVSKYLLILENTFVIQLVYPYFTNKRKEITKMPKVYFNDIGLRNTIVKSLNVLEQRADKGAIVENVIFNELIKNKKPDQEIKFWRTQAKQEVDFILESLEVMPIEVKYQSFKKVKIPLGIKSFIKNYNSKNAVIFTKNFKKVFNQNKTQFNFLPVHTISDF